MYLFVCLNCSLWEWSSDREQSQIAFMVTIRRIGSHFEKILLQKSIFLLQFHRFKKKRDTLMLLFFKHYSKLWIVRFILSMKVYFCNLAIYCMSLNVPGMMFPNPSIMAIAVPIVEKDLMILQNKYSDDISNRKTWIKASGIIQLGSFYSHDF